MVSRHGVANTTSPRVESIRKQYHRVRRVAGEWRNWFTDIGIANTLANTFSQVRKAKETISPGTQGHW